MSEFVPKQDNGRSNLNNLSYTYQNLVGQDRFENRLIEQQFCGIWGKNSLKWNFGVIYKFGQNWEGLIQLEVKLCIT